MSERSTIMNEQDRAAVNRAVGAAEAMCSAEIVPAVARSSGRYDRAEDVAGFTFAIIVFAAAWTFFQREDPSAGGWDGLAIALPLVALVALLVVAFALGIVLASRAPFVRRLFTPVSQRRAEVAARARQLFFDARVHHTEAHGGLLIYVSLEERLAVLLADDAVLGAIGQSGLDALRDELIANLRRRTPLAEALATTILDTGRRLSTALPVAPGERDELPNALVIVN